MDIKTISVIGGGTMGNGIAHVFALKGYQVNLIEQSREQADKALLTISSNLERQKNKGTISGEEKDNALKRITAFDSINKTPPDSDLIIEAIYENKEAKQNIYTRLNSLIKEETVFATNTSAISITELGSVARPDRFLGMHFMNPVPVMKLVELIRGYSTSDETFNKIKNLVTNIDKTPVEVNDYPGFIANRLLMPMINEAIYSLMEGVASVEDIDTVMKLGMNHPMGPLALADFIGLDICLNIMEVLYNGYNDSKYRPCPLLKKMVAAKKLGKKSGEGFYKY
jgi:3-hydroxybutyryl-CoA dehydrogenase